MALHPFWLKSDRVVRDLSEHRDTLRREMGLVRAFGESQGIATYIFHVYDLWPGEPPSENILELKGTVPKLCTEMFRGAGGVGTRVDRLLAKPCVQSPSADRTTAVTCSVRKNAVESGEERPICEGPAGGLQWPWGGWARWALLFASTLVAGSRQEGLGKWKREDEGWKDGGGIIVLC